ncbi:hypothetical protein J7I98_22200 [Streptomyces sp. ISL-98]|uniref:competence protein CoiA n=1 Tax=Streptomyces sp. ISL-98 TaxID=2819192 RepID=UPI001BE834D0|nr:competence protein CoiA family protein [Streptomyces sp. ISL-98]MBT2508550.1 hypothetical protein [Streptomyces sp. ISL-98]
MPLTTYLAGHGPLDATLDDLGRALTWDAVYRARPRAALTCTDCGQSMHAKMSGRGGRFFAHHRRSPHCASGGETAEHRNLKRELARAAREAGHHAELEVTAGHRGWRADVLVTAPEGRRTALEAQISSASLDDVLERTRCYRDDGIDVVWFTPHAARWLTHVPSARLHRPATPQSPWQRTHETARQFSADPCECDPSPPWHGPVHAGWDRPTDMPLTDFVTALLHGRLIPLENTTALGLRYDGWATPEDIETASAYATPHAASAPLPTAPAHTRDPSLPWYQQWPPEDQRRLLEAAKAWVRQTTGKPAMARPRWTADWLAGGLALSRHVEGTWSITRAALIRPDPARIDWELLGDIPVIVGSQEEREALKATAGPWARIITLAGTSR